MYVSSFVRKMDRDLVDHLAKPAIFIYIIFGIQQIYNGQFRSSPLVSIPKKVRKDLRLPSTSNAEKYL